MKILYIARLSSTGTGAGTYADILVREMSRRHDVKLFEREEDLKEKWDIVHVLDLKHCNKDVMKKNSSPLVIDVHDYYWIKFYPFFSIDLPARFILQKMRKGRYLNFLKSADAVISHCNYVNEMISHNKKFVVWYGIDPVPEEVCDEPRENIILFVGRDYFRKGIYPLLKSMHHVLNRLPDTKLLVVGKEYKHSRIFAKFLARGLPVEFIDGIEREKLLKLYERAKVFVLPSHIEAFGIVNIEAMMKGIPIVAARVGGIPEVIKDMENGILVEKNDHMALAEALIKCLSDDMFSKKLVESGKKAISPRFLAEHMIDSVEAVYRQIISK